MSMNGSDGKTEEGIERHIQDMLVKKRDEIEKSLAEVIDKEKEKAQQRIEALEKEFQEGKAAIAGCQAILSEATAAAESVRGQIEKHIHQAVHCRLMIQRLAEKIGEECRNAGALEKDIEALFRKTIEETERVSEEFEKRYGLKMPIEGPPLHSGFSAGSTEILAKLSRYLDGLLSLSRDIFPADEADLPKETGEEIKDSGAGPETDDVDSEAVSNNLALYLKTEAVGDAGTIRVYRKDDDAVLDPVSILEEADRLINESRSFHDRLAEAKSAKELYYFKRDILSRQDNMAKIIRRALEICRKENGDLPTPAKDILNVQTLDDLLGRLETANWSDPDDLKSFEDRIGFLQTALQPKLAEKKVFRAAVCRQIHALC
jgi:hypothetical protein